MGMTHTHYKKGDWNASCDRCGFDFKASELRREWQGLMVCKDCWEPRHPADTFRMPRVERPVAWTRPPKGEYINDLAYQLASGLILADGSEEADGSTPVDPPINYVTFGPVDPDSL